MLPPSNRADRPGLRVAVATLAVAALAVVPTLARADPASPPTLLEYELELLPGRSVGYEIEFEPAGAGLVVIDARWSGSRVVAIRVEGPSQVGTLARRTGPSPLQLRFEVEAQAAATEGPWRIRLRGLPSREHARGTLSLRLPGASVRSAGGEQPPPVVRLVPRGSEDDPAVWKRPAAPPSSARAELARLYQAIERFRTLVVDDPRPDGYEWQLGFLEFVSERRDRLLDDDDRRTPAVWTALRRLLESVNALEELRTTKDPVLLEPPPADDSTRAAWRLVRERRFGAHRRLLDELLESFRDRDRIPALRRASWPIQLVSCLQACRVHFETRHPDEGARRPHADVVASQWERLLAAGEVIRRLLAATPGMDPFELPDAAYARVDGPNDVRPSRWP